MATDSWALAVDEQEAAVKSVSGFISRRGGRSRGPGETCLKHRELPGLGRLLGNALLEFAGAVTCP